MEMAMMTARQKWISFSILVLAQLMLNVDTTIVNVALPSIQKAFNLSIESLQWMVTAYILAFGGFLLLGGRTADLFGRRRVFLWGLAGFSGASLLLGMAPTPLLVFPMRFLQGLAGAFMSPAALSMIITLFDDQPARTRALAIWSTSGAVGGTLGLLIGGVLTQYLGWRWDFFVNVPIGILAFIGAFRYLPRSSGEEREKKVDGPGALLATASLLLIVYAITNARAWGWTSPLSLGCFAVVLLLLGGFVLREKLTAHPMMPLSFFRLGNIAAANGIMLAFSMTTLPTLFFVALYNQDLNGFTPLQAGLAVVPIGIGIGTMAMLAPRFIKAWGFRTVLIVAPVTMTVACVLLTRLPLRVSFLTNELPALAIMPIGVGLEMVALIVAGTAGIPARESGLASGMINTFQQIGSSIGVAVLSSVASARTAAMPSGTASTLDGFHLAFSVVVCISITVSVMAAVLVKKPAKGLVPDAPADRSLGS